MNGESVNLTDFLGLDYDEDMPVEEGIGSFAELERAMQLRQECGGDKSGQVEIADMGTDQGGPGENNTDQGGTGEDNMGQPGGTNLEQRGDSEGAKMGQGEGETKEEKRRRKAKERKIRLRVTKSDEKRQLAAGELSLEEYNARQLERYLLGTAMREKGELKRKCKIKMEKKMEKKKQKLERKIKRKLAQF